MQLVVVMAVRKAVRAATITFTATSITLFFIAVAKSSMFNLQSSILLRVAAFVVTAATAGATRVDHESRGLSRHREVTGIHALTLRELDA